MRDILTIYTFCAIPVFLMAFVHLTRKLQDIDLKTFVIMCITSFLPVAREIILIWLWSETRTSKVLFKRYDSSN